MAFVHLHNHTQYSKLDGACRVDRMTELAVEMGMKALAITDHGNMFGAIDFYLSCKNAGIKPIIGIEAYIIRGNFDDIDSKQQIRHHLVLLAKNHKGYKNLCKLSTISFQDGFYHKPRITKGLLRQYHEGLICLTACIKGEIPSLLIAGREEDAYNSLLEYKKIFGDDLYIELQDHGIDKEQTAMPLLIDLAEKTNTEMVVTNDCHYLHKEDREAHDILLCIQTGKKETDINRMRYSTDQLYFKNEEEMRLLFPELGQAYDNTVKIAEKVDLKLDYDQFLFPKMPLPPDYKDDSEGYLKSLCYDAIPRRYEEITPEIQKRLDYELQIINKMGFNDYFLIVRDFINVARAENIPVGPGRGSAAGSIVAYLLEITQLDPLKYNLLFERFLNLSRAEMPDIDIDFDSEGRERVIEYVNEKYGSECVCQIITFGTLGAKTVVRDIARVLDVPIPEANKLAKLIPAEAKMTLEKAYKENPDLRQLIDSDPVYTRIYRIGKVLEGLIRQTGIHAAGVVIAPNDLSNYVPLAMSTKKGKGERTTLVQYEGKWLEHLKMLKMDFLGLKTLTLIRKTVDLIKKNHEITFDIENLQLEDEETYQLLSRAETDGVFQLESDGMKKYLKKLKPNRFDDIIAMVALYRPGPMQFIDKYIKRKHGEEEIMYSHRAMEKSLKETYGVLVYQEQVMQVSKDLAQFDSATAGLLRKAMSKKKAKQMAELYVKFEKGSQDNGVNLDKIKLIWSEFENFAQYAFNKSHAACYAYIAYQTAYLKTHYPVEFMAALMSEEKDPAKIPRQIEVCRRMDIEVIPPNINLSEVEFSVQGKRILYGLKGIKNVGVAAVGKIIEEREENGAYEDIWDLVTRVDSKTVNKAVIESLIAAGALDDLEGNRAQNYSVVELAIEFAASVFQEKMRGQLTLFEDFAEDEEVEVMPKLPELPEWSSNEILQKEKEVLGFFWSGHPLEKYKNLINSVINYDAALLSGASYVSYRVMMAGLVNSISTKTNRNNKPYAILELEDRTGKFELGLYKDNFRRHINKFVKGNAYLIEGSVQVQDNGGARLLPDKIYDLKNFPQGCKGVLKLELEEEKINEELSNLIIANSDTEQSITLEINLETKEFSSLLCKTNRKIKLTETFLKELVEITVRLPKLELS
ncbi:MAG: DNA polymerase III subunit alpha [Candidatus Stygibacter australis]|nr:DNA polymerase III subunit alpha [Candidatus Stygibacter australis]